MTSILWFKRDLRVSDHPALSRAAALGDVVPLYIVEPGYWALPDTSARQWAFARDCLGELAEEFDRFGVPLVIRVGDAVDVLEAVRRETGAARMVSHEETGNAWTYRRDLAVADWARMQGVLWEELAQCGVVRRLNGRDGWAGVRDGRMRQPQVAPPGGLSGPPLVSAALPDPQALGLKPGPCPGRQPGGRRQALSLLGGFLTERGAQYRKEMSSPLTAERSCSRLSPHIAFGTLSVRETAQAGAARKAEARAAKLGDWAKSMKSFESRLAWRDHFMQKLEDEPALERRCLHRGYEGLRPLPGDRERLRAWALGETGFPFVDACMRYLAHTGWLTFRMRAMVVSFASYHLWLDWRETGPILARLFTDYEPGIHWSQMQMQSGTTGINTIRMYNPVKQGLTQDPSGQFIRQWVPELADLPDAAVHEPWRWDGAGQVLGKAYPEPLVDLVQAGRAAREAVWGLRKGRTYGAEAARVVQKHASRKDAKGRFVRDRVRVAEEGPVKNDQLRLDL